MATHKQDTAGAMAPPPATLPTNSTATYKPETSGAMAPPPTTQPFESTAMHEQGTSGTVAPMSTACTTNRASAREKEALNATTFDTTIAHADPQVMASQAIPSDSASLATTMTALAGSQPLQHEPDPGADSDELEEGEILDPKDEFAALSDNHSEAESNHNAVTQNTTNNHSSSESEPFVFSFESNVRHNSSRTLKVGCIILMPKLELLGNMSLAKRRDSCTVLVDRVWFIKKLRPILIGAFIGDDHIIGHPLTTFSGTDPQALRMKYIKDGSYGERHLLEDYVQVVADHHPNQTSVPKVQQCYNNGETQLHWRGQHPPSEQACFVSLIHSSSYPMGDSGVTLVGSLTEKSCANFLAMRNAYQPKLFQPQPTQKPQPSLKRKRDASDDLETLQPPPSSAFDRPSAHQLDRVHHEEPEDLTKTSVPLAPAIPPHFPEDMRKRHEADLGRTSAAAVSLAVVPYTSLANGLARMGHSSQRSTLRPDTSTQPAGNGHHNDPEDAQNSGLADTQTEKPTCTYCGKKNHTEDECWTKYPSKKPERLKKQRATQASLAESPAHTCTVVHNHNIHIYRGDGIFAGSYGRESVPQRQHRSPLDTRSGDYYRHDRRSESTDYHVNDSRSRGYSQSRDPSHPRDHSQSRGYSPSRGYSQSRGYSNPQPQNYPGGRRGSYYH